MLGVSRMTANRAMNVLARRKVLMRYRSRGSFVGPAITPSARFRRLLDPPPDIRRRQPGLQIPAGKMLLGLHEVAADRQSEVHTIPLQGRWPT